MAIEEAYLTDNGYIDVGPGAGEEKTNLSEIQEGTGSNKDQDYSSHNQVVSTSRFIYDLIQFCLYDCVVSSNSHGIQRSK